MRFIRVIFFTVVLFVSNNAFANSLTGTIHTLHVNLQTNRAHIYFDGKPSFDGGGCPNFWTANSLDDTKFRQYIWPLLMTAKVTKEQVTVNVQGCTGTFPVITSVDVIPR